MNDLARKRIGAWLVVGVVMTAIMVIIGGVTRLTGSGLSIVEWNVIMGAIPPMNQAEWEEAFEAYKQFPQYELLNSDMDLAGFKNIFFWEYFHRLWGRLIGFVFLIPLVYFLIKKWIPKKLLIKLGILFLLGAGQGLIGWIMVASGLQDKPWVSPYKLTLHLSAALILYAYLIWLAMDVFKPESTLKTGTQLRGFSLILMITLAVQIILGGLMSGMHAGLFYPTWPKMNEHWIPPILMEFDRWNLISFAEYDKGGFATAFIQFFHRGTAYLLAVLVFIFWYKHRGKFTNGTNLANLLLGAVLLQVTLGIITVLHCAGHISVLWGSLHQAGALLLFTVMVMVLNRVFSHINHK